jgi:hypothetical protein
MVDLHETVDIGDARWWPCHDTNHGIRGRCRADTDGERED